jgi:hypothetical protein
MNKSELGTSMFKQAVSSEPIAKFPKEHSKSCWIKVLSLKRQKRLLRSAFLIFKATLLSGKIGKKP